MEITQLQYDSQANRALISLRQGEQNVAVDVGFSPQPDPALKGTDRDRRLVEKAREYLQAALAALDSAHV